jgi:bacillithiol biosynthesis cysteine-adding enzyme BshC
MPGLNRLFLDFCAGNQPAQAFFPSSENWQQRPPIPAHWPDLLKALSEQNPSGAAVPALRALAQGAGTIVTGQQVGLFGGTLLVPLKAATALGRARNATSQGHPHVGIFWLASEDHDFAEINHVSFPAGRSLEKLEYRPQGADDAPAVPVGRIPLNEQITELTAKAGELLGPSDTTDALVAAYRPGRTFARAFADFYSRIFAAQGLLVLDASGREIHRLGAPVLRAGIERADEFNAALLERNQELEAAGYHAQVAVAEHSSLLFLIDETTGARNALRRTSPGGLEPDGLWQAGGQSYSTADLIGILESAPERISPSALLRPVFQDFLLSTSMIIGGPAEIAYFGQSGVLYERILGRQTPVGSRQFASLIEPHIAKLMQRHELELDQVLDGDAASLAQRLAARSMPVETKQKLAATGNAMDAELKTLVEWMQSQDKGLGQSAETAAGKIMYQMNRLRTLAANFQLQRESTYTRHAESICNALYPEGVLQERIHGAAYYFARYGIELAETMTAHAQEGCPGHTAIWL